MECSGGAYVGGSTTLVVGVVKNGVPMCLRLSAIVRGGGVLLRGANFRRNFRFRNVVRPYPSTRTANWSN